MESKDPSIGNGVQDSRVPHQKRSIILCKEPKH